MSPPLSETDPGAHERALTLAGIATLLALATVYLQYLELFDAGAMQIERHVAVLRGEALDPWQYRLLSAWLVEAFLYAARALGLSRDPMAAMLAFRFLQNLAIFCLAGLYFRRLGLRRAGIVAGLGLLGWAMAFATYESDLSFNLYSDLIFYLLAALAILGGKDLWLVPLAALAALNRETALLIPFLLPAAWWRDGGPAGGGSRRLDARTLRITLAAFAVQMLVYAGTRFLLGPREPFHPHGVPWGWELLAHNFGRWLTWQYLLATFLVVPLVSLACYRRWPAVLRRWLWVLVPAWLAAHALLGVLAETRLLLVPYVLVLLPGAAGCLGGSRVDQPGHGAARTKTTAILVLGLAAVALTLGGCRPVNPLPRWVAIPAGVFEMGCAPGDASCLRSEERPHSVTIPAGYEMTATEITDGQYARCVASGACEPAGYPPGWRAWHRRIDLPVVRVDLARAETFCAWLGGRLPTEAEWEYAARGGREGALYPWGDELPVCRRGDPRGARFDDGVGCGTRGPGPVARFAANAWGLHDMAGNVWEWTGSGWVRGGSCFDPPPSLRISARAKVDPGAGSANIGFRCVRDGKAGAGED